MKIRSQLRIQAVIDLVTQSYITFGFSGFTRNDQAAAHDIWAVAKPRDLIIRDLGYFVLSAFRKMSQENVFFLSRLRYGVELFDPRSGKRLNIYDLLKKQGRMDRHVLLGATERLPVRLIALPVPPDVGQSRRRKAKANRDKRLKHSKEYLALLGWTLLITNVPSNEMTPVNAGKIYRLRWHIEMTFKTWKRCFRMAEMPVHASQDQVYALIYGQLIYIVLFQHFVHEILQPRVANNPNAFLSTQNIAELLTQTNGLLFVELFARASDSFLMEALIRHGCYDKRKRKNFVQIMETLG